MKRRDFVALLASAALAAPLSARAQARKPLLALLLVGSATGPQASPWPVPLRKALAGLGWEEGRNIDIVSRFADTVFDRLPALAAELVALNPDVILTHGTGTLAAAKATRTIPVVAGSASEEVLIALAGGLARPSGNVTGLTLVSHEQNAKCIELLRQIYPGANRIGVLVSPAQGSYRDYPAPLAALIAQPLLELIRAEVSSAEGLDAAFAALTGARADAVLVTLDPLFNNAAMDSQINALARARKIAVVGLTDDLARAGGLLSFGTDYQALIRNAAGYIDKILKGAKPGDLPVQRPSVYRIMMNLKSAEALGIKIPPTLLGRADEIIE